MEKLQPKIIGKLILRMTVIGLLAGLSFRACQLASEKAEEFENCRQNGGTVTSQDFLVPHFDGSFSYTVINMCSPHEHKP